MYKTFRVKNFRCFKDLQINDLGRVNLIAGKNNTGKTALMEAMYLQTKPLKPEVWDQIQKWRYVKFPFKNIYPYWEQFFHKFNSSEPIELEVHPRNTSQPGKLLINSIVNRQENSAQFDGYRTRMIELGASISEANRIVASSEAALDFQFSYPSSKGAQRRSAFLLSALDQPMYAGPGVEQSSIYLSVNERLDNEAANNQLSKLANSGKLSYLIEMLRIFEPQLTDLRLLSPYGEMLIWGKVNGMNIPLNLMGEGVNRFADLALTMTAINNAIVFIDEIENGIHHSVQCKVWKAIAKIAQEQDIQIFATTHSYEMIQAAHETFRDDNPYEFRFHRLNRNSETDQIEAVTYNQAGVDAFTSINYEVRG